MGGGGGGRYKRQYHPIPLEESVDLQPCEQSLLLCSS